MVFQLEEVLAKPIDPKSLEIFLSFDFAKKTPENLAALVENNNRDELHLAVQYIKETYKETHPILFQKITSRKSRTMANYAIDIKIFLRGLQTSQCKICEAEYCHTTAENTHGNTTKCLICNRYSHGACYKEMLMTAGIYYVCTECVDWAKPNKSQSDTQPDSAAEDLNISQISRHASISSDKADDDNEASKLPTAPPQGDHPIPNDTPASAPPKTDLISDTSQLERDTEEATEKSKKQICPLYVQGTCPHGLRGVNCQYEHPKRCRRFSAYGTDPHRGCRRGRDCWFYHPKHCQNSVQMKLCLNTKCPLAHLAGTSKGKSRNDRYPTSNRNYNRDEGDRNYNGNGKYQNSNRNYNRDEGDQNYNRNERYPNSNRDKGYRNSNEAVFSYNNSNSQQTPPQPWGPSAQKEPQSDGKSDFLEKLTKDIETIMHAQQIQAQQIQSLLPPQQTQSQMQQPPQGMQQQQQQQQQPPNQYQAYVKR